MILTLNIQTFDASDFIPVSNVIGNIRVKFEGFLKLVRADIIDVRLIVQEPGIIIPATRIKIQAFNSNVAAAFIVRK